MKTKIYTKLLTLLAGFMMLANINVAMAQVNMDRYITLTVKSGAEIGLEMYAEKEAYVLIKSGTKEYPLFVPTSGISSKFQAEGTTMTVYGDIKSFICSNNTDNLTKLDASKNTALFMLDCSNNQLTGLNVANTALNWLNCNNNQLTKLDVVSNKSLTELFCYNNQLTTLNVNNTTLKMLDCNYNKLTTLDVSKNTNLSHLSCSNNQLTTLDVSKNIHLSHLSCSNNQLTTLDVSKNTYLRWLYCAENQLTMLDISKNTDLIGLYCYKNQLTTLDISKNTKLSQLIIRGNNFSTLEIDKIYCALPQREVAEEAFIALLRNESDPNKATVLATTKANATDKNWKVGYIDDAGNLTPIGETTGNYTCPAPETYPLWVAGVQATSANASNIKGSGITGKVSYNPATNTLTLDNATITKTYWDDGNEVWLSGIIADDNINIRLIGNNKIQVEESFIGDALVANGVCSYKNIVFKGSGKLTVDVKAEAEYSGYTESIVSYGVNAYNGSISVLENSTLNISTLSSNGIDNINHALSINPAKSVIIDGGKLIFEGQSSSTAKKVPKLTMSSGNSLPYVLIRPTGTGQESLTSQGIKVTGGKGVIEINNLPPTPLKGELDAMVAQIYNVSGSLVRTLPLQGAGGLVSVNAGIYIVRIGNAAEKVVVW